MPIDEEYDQDQAVPRKRGGLAWRAALVVVIVVAICGAAGAVYETNRANEAKAGPAPATIATATGRSVSVFHDAGAAKPDRSLASPNRQGAPLTFLVLRKQGNRLQVMLPIRPNGSTGWIRTSDVKLSSTPYRIDVSLKDHRLTLYDGARTIMKKPVATGVAKTPTPTGKFYVTVLLRPMNPNGIYGPYAFGLSAYSNVLFHFGGGPGQVGLHGTNEPTLLGHPASNGCVRMSNDTVTRLAKLIPLGTPVTITR